MVGKKSKEVSILEEVEELGCWDAEALSHAQESYGDSWKKRGGVGAFMMLARKWDRIENQTKKHNYDIFEAILSNPSNEGIIDDIWDLRRYLFLVEAEIRREFVCGFTPEAPQDAPEASQQSPGVTPLQPTVEGNYGSVAEEDFPNNNPYAE